MASAHEDRASKSLNYHSNDIDTIYIRLLSLITSLRQRDLDGWRREGRNLVSWMNREADYMANVERDVAITNVTGGSASIAGGVMTGVGIVASFFTLGLAAPIAIAGLALGGAGAVTSAGGNIAQLTILQTKACEIKERCETFGKRSEVVLRSLLEIEELVGKLLKLCQQNMTVGQDVIDYTVAKNRLKLENAGIKAAKIATIATALKQQRSGVVLGAEISALVGGGSISKALFRGAGAAVGIGFGIWEVVNASGTLTNGGSHASLIRANASHINNTINDIDNALRMLDL